MCSRAEMYWLQLSLIDGNLKYQRWRTHYWSEVIEVKDSRTHFEVLGLGFEGQRLGLEASSPRKIFCPRFKDSTIFFERLKCSWKTSETSRNIREDFFCFPLLEITWKISWRPFFLFLEIAWKFFLEDLFFDNTCTCILEHSPLASDLFCVLGLEPCVLDSIDLRFSKCSLRRPRAPLKKPRVSATYSFTLFLV